MTSQISTSKENRSRQMTKELTTIRRHDGATALYDSTTSRWGEKEKTVNSLPYLSCREERPYRMELSEAIQQGEKINRILCSFQSKD